MVTKRKVKDAVVYIIFVIVVCAAIAGFVLSQEIEEDNHRKCLLAGYPEMIKKDGDYFCWRVIDGTDEVIAMERLK